MKRIIFTLAIIFAATFSQAQSPEKVVREFLKNVRSGLRPDDANLYMADTVLAHQLNSENPSTVKRTPNNYADHVREFIRLFGNYEFEITETIAQGDKVYVRWKQTGKHMAEVDGYAPTLQPLIEVTSAVYRIDKRKIVEYWIQTDRLGFDLQLERNAKNVDLR